jgi:hypothetical protein
MARNRGAALSPVLNTRDGSRDEIHARCLSPASLGLVGFCGLHRFYTGRFKTGLLWLLTLGLLGIGQIIDIFLVPSMVREPIWNIAWTGWKAAAADLPRGRVPPMSRAIMFQGTGSDVGKSLVVAGLARALANRG